MTGTGTRQGYHPVSIGLFVNELVRRAAMNPGGPRFVDTGEPAVRPVTVQMRSGFTLHPDPGPAEVVPRRGLRIPNCPG
ncbi:hypothetical protein GCM10010198_38470 [Nocardia seriolae]|nr:hypothetical protein NSERKGN1266_66450 [Nocardia seriolae]GEM26701.1 hypothetical protein NS2_49400 [Nocardia seriolae NBRC 15557]